MKSDGRKTTNRLRAIETTSLQRRAFVAESRRKTTNRLRAIETQTTRQSTKNANKVARQLIAFGRLKRRRCRGGRGGRRVSQDN